MVAGVAYSSFAFKPLWHPPLVRNTSFAIQNTIPMESMKTLKFVFFLFTRQKSWKHTLRHEGQNTCAVPMKSMILWNFVSWCLGAYFEQKNAIRRVVRQIVRKKVHLESVMNLSTNGGLATIQRQM